MKKLTIILCVIIAFFAGAIGYHFAHDAKQWVQSEDVTQEDVVDATDSSVSSPLFFKSTEEVLLRHGELQSQAFNDSVFISMSTDEINAVCKVLFERYVSISQQWIVQEYLQHQDVYNALSTSSTNKIPNTTVEVVDTPKTIPIESNGDTVINGKRYKHA